MTATAHPSADVSWLFQTNALEVSEARKPFWYTSGLIGPYYVNTHYLCGGKERALQLLSFIDENQENRREFPQLILKELEQIRSTSTIYANLIEALTVLAQDKLPLDEVDYISGGQRRDWFFAPLLGKALGKKLLFLYNDLSIYTEAGEEVHDLAGAKVANVADLLTVGSSYTTKWVPALQKVGASLLWSINVVDRLQGGVEILREAGLKDVLHLFAIEKPLFQTAYDKGLLNSAQFQLIENYISDPFEAMRSFLKTEPAFLEEALSSPNEKTRGRAKLLVDNDLYKLGK